MAFSVARRWGGGDGQGFKIEDQEKDENWKKENK